MKKSRFTKEQTKYITIIAAISSPESCARITSKEAKAILEKSNRKHQPRVMNDDAPSYFTARLSDWLEDCGKALHSVNLITC